MVLYQNNMEILCSRVNLDDLHKICCNEFLADLNDATLVPEYDGYYYNSNGREYEFYPLLGSDYFKRLHKLFSQSSMHTTIYLDILHKLEKELHDNNKREILLSVANFMCSAGRFDYKINKKELIRMCTNSDIAKIIEKCLPYVQYPRQNY